MAEPEEGVLITRELAEKIEDSLTNEVYLKTELGREVKVFSNNTVRPELILGYDLSDAGVKSGEKVRRSVLDEIIAAADNDGLTGIFLYVRKRANQHVALFLI